MKSVESRTRISRFIPSLAATLRGRLILLVCLATLPTLLFILFIAEQERSQSLRLAKQESQYLINLISREHLYQLSGAKSLLHWITDRMQRQQSTNLFRDANFLESLLAGYPQLGNIAILSPSGEVLTSAYPVSSGTRMLGYDAIERALKSPEIETGHYEVGPIVRRPVLHLAKSVTDQKGKISCVVFVAIDLDWLKSLAKECEMPAEHVLLLVDRNGTVLANSNNSDGKYPVGRTIPELSERAIGAGKIGPAEKFSFVTESMKDIPGILIATALPYQHIQNQANAAFYKMFGLLTMITMSTVVCVVLLEETTILRWLRALSRASRKFGEGDYSVRVPDRVGDGELENVARSFNSMAEALTHKHKELEDAHERLHKVTRHLQIVRESEAQRIARDLHDEVGQVLTSIKMDLALLNGKCDESCGISIIGNTAGIRQKIDILVGQIRRIASDLRPPVLDRMGLVAAIELLARNSEENSQLMIDVESEGVTEQIDGLITINLYRIAQESLTNVLRHAGATEVHVRLQQTDTEIILTVEDNGRGISDTDKKKETFGLVGMQERARLVGGNVTVESKAGKGTQVKVTTSKHLHGE
jgi:signal transduction histidine kinase